jgi:hypothetical protein
MRPYAREVWLVYELFRGSINTAELGWSVPGARNVKPELFPKGVQHLSNVSAGVVARDPNVAVGVIVKGLASQQILSSTLSHIQDFLHRIRT